MASCRGGRRSRVRGADVRDGLAREGRRRDVPHEQPRRPQHRAVRRLAISDEARRTRCRDGTPRRVHRPRHPSEEAVTAPKEVNPSALKAHVKALEECFARAKTELRETKKALKESEEQL